MYLYIHIILELEQTRQLLYTVTEACRLMFLVTKLTFYRPTGILFFVHVSGMTLLFKMNIIFQNLVPEFKNPLHSKLALVVYILG